MLAGNISGSTCADDYYLFPGVWNYEWCVSAFNGNEESAKGPAVLAPSPAQTVTEGSPGPTCPPAPSWCPAGVVFSVPPGNDSTIPRTVVQTITTDGVTITLTPIQTVTVETLTEPDGSAIILTVPSGSSVITGVETITTDGSTLTVGPVATSGITSPPSGTVTSTMTTLPPGLSLSDFTAFSITTDIWLTTTGSDASTTIVPVILPCPTCEPVIVWDIPEITWVKFDWLQLPELPPFHLPCIKIFGIIILGQCPTDSGPPPVNDDLPPDPKASVGPPPSAGSASECTVQTASECTSVCADSSCTTSCTTIVECDATGTTTGIVYTAAPWYIIAGEIWSMESAGPTDASAESLLQASQFISMYGTEYPNWPSSYITNFDSGSTTSAPPSFATCSTQNPDPDNGIAEGYCVCSGSTFAQLTNAAVTPVNYCAYTTPLPVLTTSISTLPTGPTTTVITKPTPSNTFDVYLWECGVLDGGFDEFTVGPHGGDFCSTGGLANEISKSEDSVAPATGDSFTICGDEITIGTIASNGDFAVKDSSGKTGTCTSLSLPDTTSSCTWSATSCAVLKKYACDTIVC